MSIMSSEEMTCPKCFTGDVNILEQKESFHLDNGVYYKIIHLTIVCQKGCWHNWEEFYRVQLKDFKEEERVRRVPFLEEEIIRPQEIEFKEVEK